MEAGVSAGLQQRAQLVAEAEANWQAERAHMAAAVQSAEQSLGAQSSEVAAASTNAAAIEAGARQQMQMAADYASRAEQLAAGLRTALERCENRLGFDEVVAAACAAECQREAARSSDLSEQLEAATRRSAADSRRSGESSQNADARMAELVRDLAKAETAHALADRQAHDLRVALKVAYQERDESREELDEVLVRNAELELRIQELQDEVTAWEEYYQNAEEDPDPNAGNQLNEWYETDERFRAGENADREVSPEADPAGKGNGDRLGAGGGRFACPLRRSHTGRRWRHGC